LRGIHVSLAANSIAQLVPELAAPPAIALSTSAINDRGARIKAHRSGVSANSIERNLKIDRGYYSPVNCGM
jgi:hypothetical protein